MLWEGHIIYLDMFSNITYIGSDENGMLIPAQKCNTGSYHISRCVVVAPEAVQRKRVTLMRPVLEAAGAQES